MADERVVGIDLGTTNSLVAFMEGDTPVVIPGEDGDRLLPSVVAWTDDGVVVGNAARGTLLSDSASAVYSAKRLMGRDLADVQEELKLFPFKLAEGLQPGEVLRLDVGGLTMTPPEISAYVLMQLKKNAERFFGELFPEGADGGARRGGCAQKVCGQAEVGEHFVGPVAGAPGERDLTEDEFDQAVEQRGLVRDVPVGRHRVDAELGAEPAHGELVETVRVNDSQRGGEDLIARDAWRATASPGRRVDWHD